MANEAQVNALGYQTMGRGDVDGAIALFERNVKDHPDSWNVYDSLGEALAKSGDTAAAITHYEKSLELNPDNSNAEAMIEQIRTGGS